MRKDKDARNRRANIKYATDAEWRQRRLEYQRKRRQDPVYREQQRRRLAKWQKANPDWYRRHHYQSRYGLTLEALDALLRAQGGACAICGTTEPSGLNWHVDHDHLTRRVRGILCSQCNTGIGHLQDDPSLCIKAAAYLYKARRVPED